MNGELANELREWAEDPMWADHVEMPKTYLHKIADELDRLKARNAELEAGWQPIETAPKDGTTILAYFPLEGLSKDWCRVVPIFWGGRSDCHERWIFASRAASGFSRAYQPTRWRPIPAAPAKEEDNG